MLFDNSQRQTDVFVVSSIDNFMEGMLSVRDWSHASNASAAAEQDGACSTCTAEANIDYEGNDLYQVKDISSAKVTMRLLYSPALLSNRRARLCLGQTIL